MARVIVSSLAEIPEVKLLRMPRHTDDRGFFAETYNQKEFSRAGIDLVFVQDNHSLSASRGTLRGLHFQTPPFDQDKLVRVARGRILDVVVDIRHGSPTFGRHVSAILSAKEGDQILVPSGFAHGLVTLDDDTEVIYKVTKFYSAQHDRGLRWNDPALAIDWRLGGLDPILSAKDREHPLLAELPRHFRYEGAAREKCSA